MINQNKLGALVEIVKKFQEEGFDAEINPDRNPIIRPSNSQYYISNLVEYLNNLNGALELSEISKILQLVDDIKTPVIINLDIVNTLEEEI